MQTDLADPAAVEAHHRRVRYVATYFPLLQGLRYLPLGVAFIASSIWMLVDAGIHVGEPSPRLVAAVDVPLVGAVVAIIPIGIWYRRTFGSVTMSRRTKQLTVLFMLIFVLLGLLAAPALKLTGPWMVSITLGFGAVSGAVYYWLTGKVASHYLWIGVAMLALGAMDVAGLSPFCAAVRALQAPGAANCHPASLFFSVGVLAALGAVLDHRLLVRTLPRAQEGSE